MKNNRPREQGFSLIELMVAVTLGLALSATAASLLVRAVEAANLQRGLAEINETSQFLYQFMRHEFYMAGFNGENQLAVTPIDWEKSTDSLTDKKIAALRRKTNIEDLSDKIAIHRTASINDYDCIGAALTAGQNYISILYAQEDSEGEHVFFCKRVIDNDAKNAVSLISGVDRFQVQYEVEQWVDGVLTNTFMSRAQIDSISAANRKIISVRLGLLLSDTGNPSLPLKDQTWDILDKTYDTTKSQDKELKNGHFHRVMTWTIPLRNVSRQIPVRI